MAFNIAVVVPAFLYGFAVPHVLLAVSTGLSALVNAALLFRGLRHDGIYQPTAAWRRLLPQIGLASVAMAGFLWWVSGDWSAWTDWPATQRALWLRCRSSAARWFILACWDSRARARAT